MRLIISLLFIYKDCIGIKLPTKVDMQSSKETHQPNSLFLSSLLTLVLNPHLLKDQMLFVWLLANSKL